jgi:hypothetical protein
MVTSPSGLRMRWEIDSHCSSDGDGAAQRCEITISRAAIVPGLLAVKQPVDQNRFAGIRRAADEQMQRTIAVGGAGAFGGHCGGFCRTTHQKQLLIPMNKIRDRKDDVAAAGRYDGAINGPPPGAPRR